VVEGVDLGPEVSVAEGAFGDAPQAVVDPVVGQTDPDGALRSLQRHVDRASCFNSLLFKGG